MEGVSSGGVTVVGSDAPSNYHVAPRTETPASAAGSVTVPAAKGSIQPPQPAATTVPAKKKRGRPRKYGPDGSVTLALSPKPISSAPPPVIDFSAEKRGKVLPASSVSKAKFQLENLGQWVACSVGANFTPHIITVNSGEDVTMKIISFSQQGPRAICILSANGVISSVTLRQPDSSGGTLTYEANFFRFIYSTAFTFPCFGFGIIASAIRFVKEISATTNCTIIVSAGRFEILSLSGSFMPSESGGTRSRSGGMSVSLASPDGRVVGGGVAGLLVAASPVQVVVGSFLAGDQHEEMQKKHKHEVISTTVTPTAAVPVSIADPIPNLSSSPSFRGDNWSATRAVAETRNNPTDINVSLAGG
ncbi:PPC domain [Sesbania bispinosa]|nr:PPC domain [Sesbania bispinosa]